MADTKRMDKIAKLGEKGNVKKLMAYAQGEDAQERAAAATALGAGKSDEAYHALIALLRDRDEAVLVSAVGALAQAGRKDAVEHIRRAIGGDASESLRAACQAAIAALQK